VFGYDRETPLADCRQQCRDPAQPGMRRTTVTASDAAMK